MWITCGLHLESDDLGVKPLLRFHRCSGKALEPATETAILGQIFEATEAGKQRIALNNPGGADVVRPPRSSPPAPGTKPPHKIASGS